VEKNPSTKWRKEKGDDVLTGEKAATERLRGDAHVANDLTCFSVAVAANLPWVTIAVRRGHHHRGRLEGVLRLLHIFT
jgi:hypothetical protein